MVKVMHTYFCSALKKYDLSALNVKEKVCDSFVKGSVWHSRFLNPRPESTVGSFTHGKIT